METKKEVSLGLFLALMTTFVCSNWNLWVTPALSTIAERFPHIEYSSITFVATITALLAVPSSLISGMLAGRKLRYKSIIIFAILSLAIGGIIPMLINNFTLLIISRVFVGIGCGLMLPLGYPLILSQLKGNQASYVMGIATAVMNGTGVAVQLLSGWACVISLNIVWLLHLVALIFAPLTLFFLHESKPEQIIVVDEKGSSPSNKRTPATVYLSSLGFGILTISIYPILLNMSALVTSEGLGNPGVAGTLTSMFFAGGVLAGVVFPAASKIFRRFTIPVSICVIALGMLLSYWGRSVILLGLASLLVGVSFYIIWPAIVADFNTVLPPEQMAFASGILAASLNIGMFVSSPYLSIIGKFSGSNSLRLPLLVGAAVIAVVMVLWFLTCLSKKENRT